MATLAPSDGRRSFAAAVATVAVIAAHWLPSSAAAQSADVAGTKPLETLPQVTVTARSESERRRLDQVLVPSFIRSHGTLSLKSDQLARWRLGLCPQTTGLPAAFNAFLSRRVREVAASVGAPVDASAECQPNVHILFETQPQKQLDEIVEHAPELLGAHYQPQAKRFETFSHTIQAWYVTATRGPKGDEWVDSAYGPPPPGLPGSRFGTGSSSWIVHVTVIADATKLDGYTIGSLADYVALVVLARPASLDQCDELPSVLDLLASRCDRPEKAEALTPGDSAYLKGLYSADPELPSFHQISQIHNRMMQELQGR